MEKIFKVTSELSEKVNDKTTLEVTFDYEDGKNWNCQKGYYVSTTFMNIEDCGNGIVCKNYAPHTDCKTMYIKTVKRKSQKAMRECKDLIKNAVVDLLKAYGAKAYADTLKSDVMEKIDKAVQGL